MCVYISLSLSATHTQGFFKALHFNNERQRETVLKCIRFTRMQSIKTEHILHLTHTQAHTVCNIRICNEMYAECTHSNGNAGKFADTLGISMSQLWQEGESVPGSGRQSLFTCVNRKLQPAFIRHTVYSPLMILIFGALQVWFAGQRRRVSDSELWACSVPHPVQNRVGAVERLLRDGHLGYEEGE